MIKNQDFKGTIFILISFSLIAALFSGTNAFADITNLSTSITRQQELSNMPEISEKTLLLNAFCDPMEISIAIAQNAFEKDYKKSDNEIIKVKKPVRWSIMKQYKALKPDAVPFAVLHQGTRSEGFYNIEGRYVYGQPSLKELNSFKPVYDNYAEIVFSVYTSDGMLKEDVAGVYLVNTDTQTLVTDSRVILKRLIPLFSSDSTLLVYERLCFQTAEKALNKASSTRDFSIFFKFADFIETRCFSLEHTPLYTRDDLFAYHRFIANLTQGLNFFMFQLRSGEIKNQDLVRQCKNALSRLKETEDLILQITSN